MNARELQACADRLEEFLVTMLASVGRSERRHHGSLYVQGLLLDGSRSSLWPSGCPAATSRPCSNSWDKAPGPGNRSAACWRNTWRKRCCRQRDGLSRTPGFPSRAKDRWGWRDSIRERWGNWATAKWRWGGTWRREPRGCRWTGGCTFPRLGREMGEGGGKTGIPATPPSPPSSR